MAVKTAKSGGGKLAATAAAREERLEREAAAAATAAAGNGAATHSLIGELLATMDKLKTDETALKTGMDDLLKQRSAIQQRADKEKAEVGNRIKLLDTFYLALKGRAYVGETLDASTSPREGKGGGGGGAPRERMSEEQKAAFLEKLKAALPAEGKGEGMAKAQIVETLGTNKASHYGTVMKAAEAAGWLADNGEERGKARYFRKKGE